MRDIELRTHVPLHPGQRARLELAITSDRETTIDYIALRLVGNQGWGDAFDSVHYPDLERRLMGPGLLPPGTRTFVASFQLPRDLPPTHALRPAWSRLEVIVDIAIPWWPDRHKVFELPVRWQPPPRVDAVPLAVRSAGLPSGPRLELSLASTRLVAGASVSGACAMFGVEDHGPRELELSLVPVIRARRVDRTFESGAVIFRITLPAGSGGTSRPFTLRVPNDLTPSFVTQSHEVGWQLVARTRFMRYDKLEVRVPVEVVAAGAAVSYAQLPAGPPLTDQRVGRAFEEFARQHGWRAAEGREPDEQLAIEREVGDAALRLACAHRVGSGTQLVARIAHAPLGLGLSVVPTTRLRALVTRDVAIDMPAWDRAHHVAARSEEQVVPFLRVIVPTLVATSEALGSIASWTDEVLAFERSTANTTVAELARTAAALERVAAAIARTPIAPPPDVHLDLDAWQALARELGGRLVVGDVSIRGALDQLDVAVALAWDDTGRPHAIAVHVGPAEVAAELELTLAQPVAEAAGEPAAEPVRELLARWPEDFVDLRVAEGIASAAWRFGEGPLDAARVRELALALRGLLAALEPGAGPYR